ncbi:hypothetical protein PARPLA_00337 [Rhodobacteraceae bacterium THAF1]|uniref:esterase-like activity of phytase family protein n=1 Tax=Palleronia sp. THAF1 TaxID=2587842 RepID=UPI000F3D688E|nr:esterase-like activity of phytase family protein [Palleronia sp. THAF1]QFU10098.1 hypothetical protein FIU81_15575 [Palleronia sp. THAF1]VDC16997.1 hypothetical protein PARPLA_00337 [Rhodobacteraceae bacterium THAF1]
MSDGGREAVILNDRGRLLDLRIDRTEGQISAIEIAKERIIPAPDVSGGQQDTEGLAISPDDRTFISFEGRSLVAELQNVDPRIRVLPMRPSFEKLKDNRGLEALAVTPDGALWTVPEARDGDGFPVSIWRNDAWADGPVIPREDGFVPVGLDFDDAGRLYLLERQFLGPFGFRSRVRRFDLDGDTVVAGETLIETDAGQHDNLEGIAVWRDDDGRLIATVVSDDNFFALQRTELVEYALPD